MPRQKLITMIISVFLLLTCGLFILLATVDLEPYLAPDQPDIQENVSLSPVPKTDELPSKLNPSPKTEAPSTVITAEEPFSLEPAPSPVPDKLEDLFKNLKSTATITESTTGVETIPPPTTELDGTTENSGQGQKLSSLIELEVTILPVDEYPFSILLETFLEQKRAQQELELYQERDISAHWVKVDLGEKGIRYRLFTGIFATVPEAQEYLEQNQLFNKLIKPTYYSALIGVYKDKIQLANAFVKAQETGFIPYILGTQNGVYHLYVGAFYTYAGATSQCQDLTAAGLSCKPVRRSTIPPQ